jgi:DDE superfamily endonuclease
MGMGGGPRLRAILVRMSRSPEKAKAVRYAAAVAAVRSHVETINHAAVNHNVPRTCLQRRLKSPDGTIKGVGHPLGISEAVEAGIVSTFAEFATHGLPLPSSDLSFIAMALAKAAGYRGFKASEHWILRFKARHPELRFRQPRALNVLRATSLTPKKAEEWLELLVKTYIRVFQCENPDPSRVFNFDESPMNPQVTCQKVVTVGSRPPVRVTSSYKDFFTAVICVGADGSLVAPGLIVDGKLHQKRWYPPRDGGHCDVAIACNKTHNMTEDLFASWLRYFDKSLPATVVRPVLLILDNHASHVSYNNIKLAKSLKIEMIGLPSNCSSSFQPLDVHCFQPMKTHWRTLIDSY